jgi:hypothetical protein
MLTLSSNTQSASTCLSLHTGNSVATALTTRYELLRVLRVFNAMRTGRTGDGCITLHDLRDSYDTSKHPDVLSGRRTHDQVIGMSIRPKYSKCHTMHVSCLESVNQCFIVRI